MDIATKLREKLKLTSNDNSLVDMFDDLLAAYQNRVQVILLFHKNGDLF